MLRMPVYSAMFWGVANQIDREAFLLSCYVFFAICDVPENGMEKIIQKAAIWLNDVI